MEEFCGLIVDGNTLGEAATKLNIGRRTVKTWFKQYPEFHREFEESVQFRNECWLDDNVDIAKDVTGAPVAGPEADLRPALEALRRHGAQRSQAGSRRQRQAGG
jgi:hypothetical protein